MFKAIVEALVFATLAAVSATQLDETPHENHPHQVPSEEGSNEPEVVREEAQILLLDESDLFRHEVLEQVVLENRRESVHQEEASDVAE